MADHDAGRGSLRQAAAEGPRFDLRFEAGRGLLRLARPLRAGLCRLDRLELSLGHFGPLVNVSGGPSRFRTRRSTVRRALLRFDPRELCGAAATLGVRLELSGQGADGVFHGALIEEPGAISFDAFVEPDRSDLVVHIRDVRCALDGPTSPWHRLCSAARRIGLEPDVGAGTLRLTRPTRALLAEALVTCGWRLPDERAAEVGFPRLSEGHLWLELGPSILTAPPSAALDVREESRLLGAALACSFSDDLDGALDAVRGAQRRLGARPGAEPHLARAAERLWASLCIERDAAPEQDPAEQSQQADPLLLSLALRAALRRRDADRAASAALGMAQVEPVARVAVEGLLAASELFAETNPLRAHDLVRAAASRAPADPQLVLRRIELAEAAGRASEIDQVVHRAMASTLPRADRGRLAVSAALALERAGALEAAEELWRDARGVAPDDPFVLEALAGLLARRGDRATAVERLDQAAEAHFASGDSKAAARVGMRAAELLAGTGRVAAAERRLEQAAAQDDADPALWCTLARIRMRLGDVPAAAAAYDAVLSIGARAGASLPSALVEAACFHLEDAEDREEARRFVEELERRAAKDARTGALRRRLDAAATVGEPASEMRAGADVGALLRAIDDTRPEDTRRLRAGVEEIIRAARRSNELGAVAERLVEMGRLPEDPDLLHTLERHAIDPAARAEIARRACDALRDAGRQPEAALALCRAGLALRDTATLRAALDLAEREEAFVEALEIVRITLELVGDGPARAVLLARRARIEQRA